MLTHSGLRHTIQKEPKQDAALNPGHSDQRLSPAAFCMSSALCQLVTACPFGGLGPPGNIGQAFILHATPRTPAALGSLVYPSIHWG